eukprot:1183543-Prorocentrum_minimum.AAC.2
MSAQGRTTRKTETKHSHRLTPYKRPKSGYARRDKGYRVDVEGYRVDAEGYRVESKLVVPQGYCPFLYGLHPLLHIY